MILPMPRRAKSGYVPPQKTGSVGLSEALMGTGRLPENKQLAFLDGAKSNGDARIQYAGDLSFLLDLASQSWEPATVPRPA